MFIIWLGYTYRTLAKLYLLSCSHCLASFYFTKCPPPAAMQIAALAFMSIIALLTITGSICATSSEILQQNLPGAQAESSWYPSSCGTILKERITEADWIAALEASLFWAKEYNIELEKTTKQFGTNSSHALTHLLVVREGLGVLLVFAKVSFGFLTVNSYICHDQFWQKEVFLRHSRNYPYFW